MEDKATVYIETTIPSFLTSRPSRDLIIAGRQAITQLWWEVRREMYALCISDFVLEEASRGDFDAAGKRLAVLEEIDLLEIDNQVIELASAILSSGLIPNKAATDASHIAIASRHEID